MSYPELIQAYYVKGHDGQTFEEIMGGKLPTDADYRQFIQLWLRPDSVPVLENDPINAIRQGYSFNLNRMEAARELPAGTLEHFAKYPMRMAFRTSRIGPFVHPWDLLLGYLRAPDPQEYFHRWTGEPSGNFLNRVERIFYLTRGYGLPNSNISPEDLRRRKIVMGASPTALIALSDVVGVCPTRQDPELILDKLVDLQSIDRFHLNVVQGVTECLGQKRLCSAGTTDPAAGTTDPSACRVGERWRSNELISNIQNVIPRP